MRLCRAFAVLFVAVALAALAACHETNQDGADGGRPLRTTTTEPAAALTGHDAVMTVPTAPTVKPRADDCHALVDPGYRGDCGRFGESVWVVETRGAARRALVWTAAADKAMWQLALRADDPTGDTFSDMKPAVLPTAPAAVMFGFRRPGTGDILEVDGVVDGQPGPPSLHIEAEKGSAQVVGTTLEVWSAAFGPDDPGCCPSRFTRQVVGLQSGSWRRVSSSPVAPDTVPASQL